MRAFAVLIPLASAFSGAARAQLATIECHNHVVWGGAEANPTVPPATSENPCDWLIEFDEETQSVRIRAYCGNGAGNDYKNPREVAISDDEVTFCVHTGGCGAGADGHAVRINRTSGAFFWQTNGENTIEGVCGPYVEPAKKF